MMETHDFTGPTPTARAHRLLLSSAVTTARTRLLLLALIASVVACSSDDSGEATDSGTTGADIQTVSDVSDTTGTDDVATGDDTTDAQMSDTGESDTDLADADETDADPTDADPTDAAEPDVGSDTGAPDTSITDTGMQDSGSLDTSTPDTGTVDTHTPDTADTQAGECAAHADCDAPGACTVARCIEGACTTEAAVCDDGNACTTDACDAASGCVHTYVEDVQCPALTVLWEATFDTGTLDTMVVEDLVQNVGETGTPATWSPDSGAVHSGAGALYFGLPGLYDYDTGLRVAATASTPPLVIPEAATAQLTLFAWFDVEPEAEWDVLSVSVLTDDSATPVWVKPAGLPQSVWTPIVVDLSAFAGSTVSVVVTFDSIEATLNATTGVYVDTVRVTATDGARACTTAADCSDAISCTVDACVDSVCTWTVDPTCCIGAGDCFDGDVCTIDICTPEGVCANEPVPDPLCCNTIADCDTSNPCADVSCTEQSQCSYTALDSEGCCTKDSDCNDSESCTIDSCADFQCQHVNTCCQSDAECNDGDDICTDDACVNGACVFTLLPVAGCCEPLPYDITFDDGDTSDWTISNASTDCIWSVVDNAKSKSAPASLYFGNPTTKQVTCSTSGGTATSPELEVPDRDGVKLEFDLWYEVDAFLDTFDIIIVNESGATTTIFTPNTLGTQSTWKHHTKTLNAYKGQTIRVRFSYNGFNFSGDLFGWLTGVYVDNIQITDPCL